MRRLRPLLIVFLTITSLAPANPPSEATYKFKPYSYQSTLNRIVFSHSFARFEKTNPDGTVEVVDISWLPLESEFRGRRNRLPLMGTHPGRNYSLEETFSFASQNGLTVNAHSEVEISKEVFERALQRKRQLESGTIQYSLRNHPPYAINCIEAVSNIFGSVNTGLKHGPTATNVLVQQALTSSPPVTIIPSESIARESAPTGSPEKIENPLVPQSAPPSGNTLVSVSPSHFANQTVQPQRRPLLRFRR